MPLSSLYIPYLFDIIDREPHISVNIRYLFPMQPVNTDNGGTVWQLLAHPKRWSLLRCIVYVSPRARRCFCVLGSERSAMCSLSYIKVQWARWCFSFLFCPHSVPSFYPFADRQPHLCFWVVLLLLVIFCRWRLREDPTCVGSWAESNEKSIAAFYAAGKWKRFITCFFSAVLFHCFPPLVPLTAVGSAAQPLMSSQRLDFISPSFCLSVCLSLFLSCLSVVKSNSWWVQSRLKRCFCMRDIIGTSFRITSRSHVTFFYGAKYFSRLWEHLIHVSHIVWNNSKGLQAGVTLLPLDRTATTNSCCSE